MAVLDLNADVGEWDGDTVSPTDRELIPLISSANVACGGHAGNDAVMASTVAFAAGHGVAVGAHPGFEDRPHFGRRDLGLAAEEVSQLVRRQLEVLQGIATSVGVPLRHVKPHGALYNIAARNADIAATIARAVAKVDGRLILIGLAGSRLIDAGRQAGLATRSEVFADRHYQADGSLASRDTPGAVIHDPDAIAARAVKMVRHQEVLAMDGTPVHLTVETLCVHGDTPGAPVIARRVRQALEAVGVRISAIP